MFQIYTLYYYHYIDTSPVLDISVVLLSLRRHLSCLKFTIPKYCNLLKLRPISLGHSDGQYILVILGISRIFWLSQGSAVYVGYPRDQQYILVILGISSIFWLSQGSALYFGYPRDQQYSLVILGISTIFWLSQGSALYFGYPRDQHYILVIQGINSIFWLSQG